MTAQLCSDHADRTLTPVVRREGWTPIPADSALEGPGLHAAFPALGTAWTDYLHTSFAALGLCEVERRDLTRVAALLQHLAPKAHARMTYAFERIARSMKSAAPADAFVSRPDGGVTAPDQPRVRMAYISLGLSVHEAPMPGSRSLGPSMLSYEPRNMDVAFESLTISLRSQSRQGEAAPVVIGSNGMELRQTADAIQLVIDAEERTDSPHRTSDSDALRFYDANMATFLHADPAQRTVTLFFELGGDDNDVLAEAVPSDHFRMGPLAGLWNETERDMGLGLATIERRDAVSRNGRYGLLLDYWFGYMHRSIV